MHKILLNNSNNSVAIATSIQSGDGKLIWIFVLSVCRFVLFSSLRHTNSYFSKCSDIARSKFRKSVRFASIDKFPTKYARSCLTLVCNWSKRFSSAGDSSEQKIYKSKLKGFSCDKRNAMFSAIIQFISLTLRLPYAGTWMTVATQMKLLFNQQWKMLCSLIIMSEQQQQQQQQQKKSEWRGRESGAKKESSLSEWLTARPSMRSRQLYRQIALERKREHDSSYVLIPA